MDGLPQGQPQPQAEIPQKSFFQTPAGKITALVGTLAILLIALVILNYFNILPLSQIYPQLSFLPQKQATLLISYNLTSYPMYDKTVSVEGENCNLF